MAAPNRITVEAVCVCVYVRVFVCFVDPLCTSAAQAAAPIQTHQEGSQSDGRHSNVDGLINDLPSTAATAATLTAELAQTSKQAAAEAPAAAAQRPHELGPARTCPHTRTRTRLGRPFVGVVVVCRLSCRLCSSYHHRQLAANLSDSDDSESCTPG